MECFIGWIKPIEFIGACGDDPGPPVGQVAWDEETPWDNNTYWT